jgi:mannose-6-phosphate isomerase-like protein (cupin superfamily)
MARKKPLIVPLQAARSEAPEPGRISALMLQHGSMELRWYAPSGDDMSAHNDRDELYIVASGWGWFVREDQRVAFGPGDALFVGAYQSHRFENFTEDLAVWVIFYGPVGGEEPL